MVTFGRTAPQRSSVRLIGPLRCRRADDLHCRPDRVLNRGGRVSEPPECSKGDEHPDAHGRREPEAERAPLPARCCHPELSQDGVHEPGRRSRAVARAAAPTRPGHSKSVSRPPLRRFPPIPGAGPKTSHPVSEVAHRRLERVQTLSSTERRPPIRSLLGGGQIQPEHPVARVPGDRAAQAPTRCRQLAEHELRLAELPPAHGRPRRPPDHLSCVALRRAPVAIPRGAIGRAGGRVAEQADERDCGDGDQCSDRANPRRTPIRRMSSRPSSLAAGENAGSAEDHGAERDACELPVPVRRRVQRRRR